MLFLPKWYPNRVTPTNGNFIEMHACAVALFAKVSVLVVNSEVRSGPRYEIERKLEHGFMVTRVYFRKPKGIFKALVPYFYLKSQLKGYNTIKKEDGSVDLSHVHVLTRSGILALWLKWTRNIPYLLSEHWSGYSLGKLMETGSLNRSIRRIVAAQATYLTSVSAFLKDAMLDAKLNGKYFLVPNAVDVSNFHLDTSAQTVKPKIKFLHVSNLEDKVKQVSAILRAFKRAHQNLPNIELHLIGDGPERIKHEQRVADLGIQDCVFFHGDIERKKVAEQMKTACGLIIFSKIETQSVVMLEAFCCGLPVIAVNVGGISEHLNTERGILLNYHDEKKLAEAIEDLYQNQSKINRDKIASYGKENFSLEAVGNKFAQLYEKTLKA